MKYPEITVNLIGQDGNIFGIMGKVTQALRQNLPKEVGKSEADKFCEEVFNSNSYVESLNIVTSWVNVS